MLKPRGFFASRFVMRWARSCRNSTPLARQQISQLFHFVIAQFGHDSGVPSNAQRYINHALVNSQSTRGTGH